MSGEGLIDRARIQSQVELMGRITKNGEVDLELALKERLALADRVENKRSAFITWMKKEGYSREEMDYSLAQMDRLLAELRAEPFSPEAFTLGL